MFEAPRPPCLLQELRDSLFRSFGLSFWTWSSRLRKSSISHLYKGGERILEVGRRSLRVFGLGVASVKGDGPAIASLEASSRKRSTRGISGSILEGSWSARRSRACP